ncbi:reprolysin-like metallopeptidase [Flavobacterium sp.]|uniref:zinc-dependent metalloprotease n=1 Tax=Flavobacterium sp. TaxID=239 RepID=UPI00248A6A79|nr:zinc-dependent metalloprotease family protein [Flavobacterium sp.]MDI1318386.1 M12 family metallo-peptidase [Flavobacterium sp.]
MKKLLLLVVFIVTAGQTFAQRNSAWKQWDSNKTISSELVRQTSYSQNQQLLQFDAVSFKQALATVSQKSSGQAGVEIQLPNIKGVMEKFLVWESSNFEPALQAQYPEIRAFVGKGITDPSATLNFSFDPKGIKTMVFRAGSGSEFIEPYTKDSSVYVVFDSATRYKSQLPFVCSTEDFATTETLGRLVDPNSIQSSAQSYKTMRLALSVTAEYTIYHGGTVAGALAAMNATMARCNGVFEKDLAIKLLLVNNTTIIYTNAATDPYSTETGTGAPAAWNGQLQATLNSVVGAANYDIGHLFGATGGGGSAGCIGCVCLDANKGSGITSPADGIPEGDTFDIDYVAHEMGHQMGANHTFSHTTENNSVNVEPGSGTTIMAYAGIGGNGTDIQGNSDDYYTFRSISQIQSNMNTKTCPVSISTATSNPRPGVITTGPFTIPISTAFKLTGSGTGTTGEVLTYCWEENDDATTSLGAALCIPSPTKTDGPNFRSRIPVTSPIRYMPQFADVLAGNLTPTWEVLSSVARTLNFSLTVRDNVLGGGQTNSAATVVSVVDAGGAFSITNPSVNNTSWLTNSTQTLTWNVAGTTGSGINTANVNILISIDGGTTFTTLLANTANDGSESITLPATPSPNCRILIEAVGNIFYAVSKNIALGYTITNACNTYTFSGTIPFVDQAPGTYTTRTLNVPVGGTISDVNVFNSITHTYLSDVQTDISSPQDPSTFVKLFNRSCGNTSATVNLKFSDDGAAINCAGGTTLQTVIPGASLAAFNGQNPVGNWTFRVYDNFTGDTGTINSWGIEVCTQTITLATPSNQLTDFSIYPNPNKGNFTIQFDTATSSEIKVNVYDMRGRTIFENKYSNQAVFNENIQLSNAQSGVYLVSVTDGTNKIVKRIVIE